MSIARINQYYRELEDIYTFSGATNETSIRRVTANLISDYAKEKHLMLVDEIKLPHLSKVPDGALQDTFKFNYGYWEAKDLKDDLEKEIQKKINIGYPTENLLIEDSKQAVLIRGDLREYCDMTDAKALDKFLTKFVSYIRQETLDFREALEQFAKDTPKIVQVLEDMIAEQVKTNPAFEQKRQAFFDLCQSVINPTITFANIDEMLIQHILTEEIFFSIMDDRMFHEDNNISRTLTDIEKTFFIKDTKRQVLAKLEPYYKAVKLRASGVHTHEDKQDFLKAIYESFYKAYNPASADRLGIVYTPSEVVRFMIESTEYLLEKYFNKTLSSTGVEILDPATGTGTFITDLIKHLPAQALEYKYKNEIHANEVAILPYYIANLNIEYIYKQKMKGVYAEFTNLCFVDTLDNTDALKYAGKQGDMFGALAENAQRIKAQNDRKISVIIGNPPYNARQANFNDQNANRVYKEIDKQIKTTFVKQGNAQNQNVLYDMYVRFYRWAMNRIDAKDGGIVAFITNRSFIDSRTFDGFRKCAQEDFQEIYVVDLMGDVRQNNTAVQGGNIFNIMTGVAIAFFIKIKDSDKKKARIQYYNVGEGLSAKDKLNILKDNKIKDLDFKRILPDAKHNWINLTDNDWDTLMPLCSKEVKAGKGNDKAIFELFSLGIATHRDNWNYDFNKDNLKNKVEYFIDIYTNTMKDKNFKNKDTIAWDADLEKYALRKIDKKFEESKILKAMFRPFVTKYLYFDNHLNSRLYQWENIYNIKGNVVIAVNKEGSNKPFHCLVSNKILDLHTTGDTNCLPLYRYEAGKAIENITDWALGVFRDRYRERGEKGGWRGEKGDSPLLSPLSSLLTKEDIFHYVYAVLHAPAYREKYAQNLKRDFPRIPLYDDFWKYAQAGKELMELHLWEGGDGSMEKGEDGMEAKQNIIYDLQRFTSLANVYEFGNGSVQNNAVISKGGVVWLDESSAACSGVYTIKYSRRSSAEQHPTIFAIPINSARFIGRGRNTAFDSGTAEVFIEGNDAGVSKTDKFSREFAGSIDEGFREKTGVESKEVGDVRGENAIFLPSLSSLLSSLKVHTLSVESVLPKRKKSDMFEAEQAELIKNYVPEVKLRVKEGDIEIDSLTTITGVPAVAFEYKLGNRSAIEWVLDQYKPYKSNDKTIQENFNAYKFADYKQEVIDLLLRVIYVSVKTMKVVRSF